MSYRVTVRINSATGEIEVFQVDDLEVARSDDHDLNHEGMAQGLGELVERRPDVEELPPAAAIRTDQVPRQADPAYDESGQAETDHRRDRQYDG